jgi:hypothetical protein
MKKLILLLLICIGGRLAFAQTPITPQFKQSSNHDFLQYGIVGNSPFLDTLARYSFLRSLFLQKADSAHYITPYYFNAQQVLDSLKYVSLLANQIISGQNTFSNATIFQNNIYLPGVPTDAVLYENGSGILSQSSGVFINGNVLVIGSSAGTIPGVALNMTNANSAFALPQFEQTSRLALQITDGGGFVASDFYGMQVYQVDGIPGEYVNLNGTWQRFLTTADTTGGSPTGVAGGDLGDSYPNPTVNQINGITKSYYDPTSSIQTQLNAKLSSMDTTSSAGAKGRTQANSQINTLASRIATNTSNIATNASNISSNTTAISGKQASFTGTGYVYFTGGVVTYFTSVSQETPSGSINSSNKSFTLAFTPIANSETLILNGVILIRGVDYTISGATITSTNALITNDIFRATYNH